MEKRKKTGGRKPGSPNKVSASLKSVVQAFLDKNAQDLQREYEMLDSRDKLIFFERLLRYAIPTQSAQKIDLQKLSDDDLDLLINKISNHE